MVDCPIRKREFLELAEIRRDPVSQTELVYLLPHPSDGLSDRVDHKDPDVVATDQVNCRADIAAAYLEDELASADPQVAETAHQHFRSARVQAFPDDGGEL